jgi:hypothetical protein
VLRAVPADTEHQHLRAPAFLPEAAVEWLVLLVRIREVS